MILELLLRVIVTHAGHYHVEEAYKHQDDANGHVSFTGVIEHEQAYQHKISTFAHSTSEELDVLEDSLVSDLRDNEQGSESKEIEGEKVEERIGNGDRLAKEAHYPDQSVCYHEGCAAKIHQPCYSNKEAFFAMLEEHRILLFFLLVRSLRVM